MPDILNVGDHVGTVPLAPVGRADKCVASPGRLRQSPADTKETSFMTTPRPIAAVLAPGSAGLDALFAAFAARLRSEGHAVGGVLQSRGADGAQWLTDIATGAAVNISQNLGPLASSCHLDSSALAGICGGLERQVDEGLELIVLNRFGKAEAEGHGLRGVLERAVVADTPVLLNVRPDHLADWQAFHDGGATDLPAELDALVGWAHAVFAARA